MKPFFRQLNMIFLAFLTAQIGFAIGVLVLEGIPTRLGTLSLEDPFLLFGVAVMFMSIFTANWLNEQRKNQGARLDNLVEKKEHYRNLVIIRSAIVEGANLMALVFAFVSRQGFFFLLFAAGLVAFLYFRPSPGELRRDYNLRPDEERDFDVTD